MLNKFSIILVMSLLIIGCGHPKFDLFKPPAVTEDNRALIMVYRDGKRPGTHHWIGLNGRLIAELKEKEYTEFYVSAGTNRIFTKCTLPTYHFDMIMQGRDDPDHVYEIEPFVTKDLSMCYMSSENEIAIGGSCSLIKLEGQPNAACEEKRKQLSFVEPGTGE